MSLTVEQTMVDPPEYSNPPRDLVHPRPSIKKGIAGKEESAKNEIRKLLEIFKSLSTAYENANVLLHNGCNIFDSFVSILTDITTLWHLFSETGFNNLHDVARKTCVELTMFKNRSINSSCQLPELGNTFLDNPSLIVAANRHVRDCRRIWDKLLEFRLILCVLLWNGEKDGSERNVLMTTITNLYPRCHKDILDAERLGESGSGSGSILSKRSTTVKGRGSLPHLNNKKSLSTSSASPMKVTGINQDRKWFWYRLISVPTLPLTPAFCTLPPQGTLHYDMKLASACTVEYFSRWIDNWPERPDLESLEFTEAGVRRAMTTFHIFHFTPGCVSPGVDPWYATKYTCRSFSECELPKQRYQFFSKPSACQKRHIESLLFLLDFNEQQKSIYNFSEHRVSASENDMVVIVRKSPRDLAQPQNAYAQAWIRPPFPLSVRPPHPQGSNLAEKLVKLWIK